MCGACGDRAVLDWARPFVAGVPARTAVAAAVTSLLGGGAPRVRPWGSGWLLCRPTGASVACGSVTELVAAVRPWLTPIGGFAPARRSGRLAVPPPRDLPVRLPGEPRVRVTSPEHASDLVAWVECGRQTGVWESGGLRASCALDEHRTLRIEVDGERTVHAAVLDTTT